MAPPDRPVYVGNFAYETEEWEVRKLMEKYGDVERIDMKQGFAFVYMAREDDVEYAIRKLDGMEWAASVGRERPLRLQWAKQKEADRVRRVKPTETLFVVNFDVNRVRTRDVERLFETYGNLKRVEIRKNYAFVQFEQLEDAEYALKKTDKTMFMGRTITVEYCQNTAGGGGFGGGGGGYGGGGGGGRRSPSPAGRRRSYSRSRSPVRRRPSPSPVGRRRSYSRSRSPVRRRASPSPAGRGRSLSRSASPPKRARSGSP